MAVYHVDVVDICAGVESDDLNAVFALFASHVLDVDIAHDGEVATAAYFIVLVVEVDLQYRFAALSHFDVAGVDIFDDSATAGVGLDSYHAVKVGAVHLVVFGIYVAASS